MAGFFCSVCLKKLEPILSRILTDLVRSACLVTLNRIARSDCVVMRTNAPGPRSRIRADETQKFSLPFLFSSAESVGGADKKWKGNFWFCFAVSINPVYHNNLKWYIPLSTILC